jgi:hypothetical protein
MNCTVNSNDILLFEHDQKESISLPFKELNRKDFAMLVKGEVSAIEKYKLEIDVENVKNIELISLYSQNDTLSWNKFEELFLQGHTLYYLGTYVHNSTNLSLVKYDFPGRDAGQRNSSLYMIVESQASIWTTPIALEVDRGWENQILSRTIFDNSIFTYQDFSDGIICAAYKIDGSGKIKVLNKE